MVKIKSLKNAVEGQGTVYAIPMRYAFAGPDWGIIRK